MDRSSCRCRGRRNAAPRSSFPFSSPASTPAALHSQGFDCSMSVTTERAIREVDRKLVESVLDEAKQEYAEKAKVHLPIVTIDDHVYLPPPPVDVNSHDPFCSGAVVLASEDGKIVTVNTLDARLELAFIKKLPEIRKRLIGEVGG